MLLKLCCNLSSWACCRSIAACSDQLQGGFKLRRLLPLPVELLSQKLRFLTDLIPLLLMQTRLGLVGTNSLAERSNLHALHCDVCLLLAKFVSTPAECEV